MTSQKDHQADYAPESTIHVQKLQTPIVKNLPEYDFYLIICILDQLFRDNQQLYPVLIKRNIKLDMSYFVFADFGSWTDP